MTSWKRQSSWLAAVALAISNPFLHKSISDVCDWARARWGFSLYDRTALFGIPLVSLAIAIVIFGKRWQWRVTPATLARLLFLAVLTAAAQHWLLVANIELIHFPQYALLAGLLVAAGLNAPAAYLVATTVGLLDETYQYFVVYAGVPNMYFDINDIVLNAIGAAWGALLAAELPQDRSIDAVDQVERRQLFKRGAAVLLVLLPLTVWLDPPHFVPLLRQTDSGRAMYRVLSSAEGLVVLTLLWGLATRLMNTRTSGNGARPSPIEKSALASVGVVLSLFFSGCASAPVQAAARQVSAPTPASRPASASSGFITTFWCGPPLDQFDDARAEEIAAAGFTIVGPPCERRTGPFRPLEALDVAARHGLKMWLADVRYDERAPTRLDWREQLAAAVADYKERPGFGGYFLADEPSAAQFGDLAAIAASIRELDPGAFIYVNLFADYLPNAWGTPTYREYVEQFVTTVRPSILSYDYYPFTERGDRPTFFSNLTIIREVALAHDVPFMLIVLAMPHGPYRAPTEAELSWQALHALAYGVRGLSYFAVLDARRRSVC